MVELVATHRGEVELEPLKVHDEGGRQLLDRAPTLRSHALPALLAQVAVIPLQSRGPRRKSKTTYVRARVALRWRWVSVTDGD